MLLYKNDENLSFIFNFMLNKKRSTVKESNKVLNNFVIFERKSKGFTKQLVYNGTKYEKLNDILGAIETEIITEALEKTDNKSEAIQLLGLSRRTFYHKIKKMRS